VAFKSGAILKEERLAAVSRKCRRSAPLKNQP